MKFENLYIQCENLTNRNKVISIAESIGYKRFGNEDNDENVVMTDQGDVFDLNWSSVERNKSYTILTYSQFMEKYGKQNKMIELINKAKSYLKMNDSELSLALGKSRQYIGKMLRLPQSKKVQDKVIKEISEFMDKVKNQVVEIVNPNDELAGAMLNQAAILSNKDKEISDLKKANEQQKLVIDKLDDQLIKAEKIHNEDVKAIDLKDKEIVFLSEVKLEHEQKIYDLSNSVDLLTKNLEQSKRETDYFVNQFKRVEDELKELKSSHTTSKTLNWFFVVAVILAAIVWKASNG